MLPDFIITIKNVTTNTTVQLAGHAKVLILKVYLNTTIVPKPTVNVLMKMRYDCSIPPSNIAPYILQNGTWQPITPFSINTTACFVSFNIAVDPIVALFQLAYPSNVWLYAVIVLILLLLIFLIVLLAKRRRKKKEEGA